jgi:hypothetical protein
VKLSLLHRRRHSNFNSTVPPTVFRNYTQIILQMPEVFRRGRPRSRLEQLPLEAKQAILSSLTDISSLKATALTCSSLYHAFKNAEELIFTEVLINEIDISVLPEALIAHKSETWCKPSLFAAENLQSRQPISSKTRWKIPELLPLCKAAQHVNYFAANFAETALSSKPRITGPPSREEMNRFKRAFYRFEIYCNMFARIDPPSGLFQPQVHAAPAAIFFACFSPWENEQLACVYDYLFSIIAPGMPSPFIVYHVALGSG